MNSTWSSSLGIITAAAVWNYCQLFKTENRKLETENCIQGDIYA